MKRILRPDIAFGLGVAVAWALTGEKWMIIAGSCVGAMAALHHISMGFIEVEQNE